MWCIRNLPPAGLLCVVLLLAVAGCGFRPLHGGGAGGAPENLATIEVARIADRVGQKLRNLLLDRLAPTGQSAQPRYRLTVGLKESLQNLAIRKDETATRANLTLSADFSLHRLESGETYTGTAISTNGYNILQSDFATLSVENDARDRALRTLAEEIRARVAAALANPQFFRPTAGRK